MTLQRKVLAVVMGLVLIFLFAGATEIGEGDTLLRVERKTGLVETLQHRPTGASWVNKPFNLFKVAGDGRLHTELETRPTAEGLLLTLSIRNTDAVPRLVTPAFPTIELKGADPADHRLLRYCFPARSAFVGRENRSDEGWYSGIFPVQFMAVDHPAHGSLHVVIRDTGNDNRKLFRLSKTDEALRLSVTYEGRTLAPGEEWVLPSVMLATTEGTWHSGLKAYRSWLRTWYRIATPRNATFREVFNFRVHYLFHPSTNLNSGIFSPDSKKWTLLEAVDRDVSNFGGADFVHLYDWSQTPQAGRVGDYAPWTNLGGLETFRGQIKALQSRNIPVGLYLEGYLVSPESQVAKKFGQEWMMTDDGGASVDQWGGGYRTMCQYVPGWQAYLSSACGRLAKETGAAGLYLDEFGFLCQYRCSNPAHAKLHVKGAHMLSGELAVLRQVRSSVGNRSVLYTEEIPTDVMTQFSDGAYTASVKMSLKKGVSCPIHLTRFALPDFKTIELLSEEGLKDDLTAIRATFFNGEGLYLSGQASSFSPACLALIQKTHAVLRKYADAFTSLDPLPLVPTLDEKVCANRFPSERRVVWTLFNTVAQPFVGPALRVTHRPGARYYDAWNGGELKTALTEDGQVEVQVNLSAGDVGCVVQSW
jgi:hypothetical protein